MIDLDLIRNQPAMIKEMCAKRADPIDIDALLEADGALRETTLALENLRAEQKRLSKGPAGATDEARKIKEDLKALEEKVRPLEEKRNDLWARVPNLLAEDTPEGATDEQNVPIFENNRPRKATGPSHEEIGKSLKILDLERGAEVAGSGFYYWRGEGSRLAWAVFSLTLDLLYERGFETFLTPLLARKKVFFGTGYLPFFDDQIYKVENEEVALIGTSEQTLIGYYGDQMMDPAEFPRRMTAFTPCFRTEAGAAGRAGRGAFRVHQFHKVEQIVICRPEDSEKELQACQRNAQDIMELLELPYHVVRVCTGDLGAPAYKKLDTEAWFPGFGAFRETHSNSNLLDYQTRRFDIRYKEGGKRIFPHTISATAITDRAVLAMLENHVQEDGSVYIPVALRKYMGGLERITKK